MKQKEFEQGWKHFCKCINFGESNLDAEAIAFMNEVPGKILKQLEAIEGALRIKDLWFSQSKKFEYQGESEALATMLSNFEEAVK